MGCSFNPARPRGNFRAPDTTGRVPAIVDAADRQDEATLNELIHVLMDEDPAVRLFAIQSLIQRTGQDFGYRYYEAEDQRRAALTRWYDWLHARGEGPPATTEVTTPTD